jgi:hypothetical protein
MLFYSPMAGNEERMNFRKLIEKAMYEVRDEFAVIVQRKLAELMGDAEASPRGSALRGPTARAEGKRPVGRPPKESSRGRSRAPADHMAELREKVLAALHGGEPMKKNQIMRAAKLDEDEASRVGSVLRKLKDERVVTMKGQKAVATYTLEG